MSTAQQVLDLARSQLGYFESPRGSNRTKYGVAYGADGHAWCATFCWWLLTQSGVPIPLKAASVYALLNAYMVSATLESEAVPTVEFEATGSLVLVCRVLGSDAGQGVEAAVA